MPEFEFRLLGTVRAIHRGTVLDIAGPTPRAVLAVLLLHAREVVPKTRIIRYAWRDDPPDTAEALVADYVIGLRKALTPAFGRDVLPVVRGGGYRADIDRELVDVHRFKLWMDQAAAHRDSRELDLAPAPAPGPAAVDPGVSALADMESAWLRDQARALSERRLDALEQLAASNWKPAARGRRRTGARHRRDTPATAKTDRHRGQSPHRRRGRRGGRPAGRRPIAALRESSHDPSPALLAAQTAALNHDTGRPDPAARGPLHQLPVNTDLFGRDRQIAELLELAVGAGQSGVPGTVVISQIDGMAGIGKTALAVYVGHLLTDQFPGGRLYVDLNAYTPGTGPRDPGEVLGQLLLELGVHPGSIPTGLDGRAKAYRDRLAGTRTLILLDNAISEQQVRPLLPAAPGCLVLVTSRHRLKALDDAHPIPLDVLDAPDAVALFVRFAGSGRTTADDPTVHRITELCGYLPLTLRIAAALLKRRPAWNAAHLEQQLLAGRDDLSAFDDGERQAALIFNLSYDNLAPDQQQMFRRLGLIPGPDTDAYAAATLLDTDPRQADRLLQDLLDRSLLTETTPGRYRLHDLLRIHARIHTEHDDTHTDRESAQVRLLDYYQHTAAQADTHLEPRTPAHPVPEPAHPPRHTPALNDRQHAEAWLTTELDNLIAAARHATTRPDPTHAVTLPAATREHLRAHGPWTQAVELHTTAAHIAHTLGNHPWHADALHDLGIARRLVEDYSGAQEVLRQALTLYQDLGNQLGQANTLNDLGIVRRMVGDYSGAQEVLRQALTLYQDLGNQLGQANTLNDLGIVRRMVGDYSGAQEVLRQALTLYQNLGHQLGQANTLKNLGRVRRMVGDYSGAQEVLRQALTLYQNLGNRLGQANTLNDLGRVRYMVGDYSGAQEVLRQALTLHQNLGHQLGQANTLNDLGIVRHMVGDYSGAQEVLRQALTLYQDLGHQLGQANTLKNLGRVRRMVGDYSGAQEVLWQALTLYQDLGSRLGQASALNDLGIALCLVRDLAGAEDAHCRSLDLSRELGSRGNEAWALTWYAAVPLARGDVARALELYRQALAMNREVQHPDDEALALEGIGECLLSTGQVPEATEHLRQASALFQRLGMQRDVQRITARLADLTGP